VTLLVDAMALLDDTGLVLLAAATLDEVAGGVVLAATAAAVEVGGWSGLLMQ